jgi:hypothetical protein
MKPLKQPFHAFTIKHSGRVNQITTDLKLSIAFDPQVTDPDQVAFISTKALWDTGATKSVITQSIAQQMGLVPVGSANVNHAGGSSITNTYLVNFYLPNNVGIAGVLVSECPPASFGAIIGMDIIAGGDLSISNADNQTWLTFRYPSYKGTDYVVEAHRITFAGVKKYAPCPCGQKDKFGKPISFGNCHGKGM